MSTTQNAVLTIGYGSLTVPAGSVVDHVTVSASALNPANSPPNQSIPPPTTTVTFSNLTPDTYTFTVQAFPAVGPGFGAPVSATQVVTGTTVILQVPVALSVTQP